MTWDRSAPPHVLCQREVGAVRKALHLCWAQRIDLDTAYNFGVLIVVEPEMRHDIAASRCLAEHVFGRVVELVVLDAAEGEGFGRVAGGNEVSPYATDPSGARACASTQGTAGSMCLWEGKTFGVGFGLLGGSKLDFWKFGGHFGREAQAGSSQKGGLSCGGPGMLCHGLGVCDCVRGY